MTAPDELAKRALARVETCTDPKELRTIVKNADAAGRDDVSDAARRKLYEVSPSAEPGTLEHDVWRSVYALEDALTKERGKTTLLGRTRQKIARDGEVRTVSDLVNKAASEGFKMLLARGWPELTFEAVALRHEERFTAAVLAAARERLKSVPDDR